jgi:acyl-CoA dehydrogenase
MPIPPATTASCRGSPRRWLSRRMSRCSCWAVRSSGARSCPLVSQLYLASATLKRYEDDGRPAADLPLVHWGLQDCLHRAEDAFAGLVENFPSRPMAWLIRLAAFPLGRTLRGPDDRLGGEVTRLLAEPSAARDRLTRGMYLRKDEADPVGRLEVALDLVVPAEAVEAKLRAAAKAGVLHGRTNDERRASALSQGIITVDEAALLDRFKRVQRDCIMVDDFPHDIGRNVATGDPEASKWQKEAA